MAYARYKFLMICVELRFLHACFSSVFAPYFDANVFDVKNIINKIKMDIWAKYGPNFVI